jgi:hypothetical protein
MAILFILGAITEDFDRQLLCGIAIIVDIVILAVFFL